MGLFGSKPPLNALNIFSQQLPPPVAPQRNMLAQAAPGMGLPQKPPGLLFPGNIDLNKRKVLHNRDGSISTESSISIGTDQGEVLIPTVIDGKRLTPQQAIDYYRRTGQHLGIFDTPQNANAFAVGVHNRQADYYGAGR